MLLKLNLENLSYTHTPCTIVSGDNLSQVEETSHYLALSPEAQEAGPLLSRVTCQLVLN